jgi:pyruvate-formate lyase
MASKSAILAEDRIQRLRESIRVDKYPLCVEKIRLFTESFQKTQGQPQIIRRAKALANVLDKISIFIQPGELAGRRERKSAEAVSCRP